MLTGFGRITGALLVVGVLFVASVAGAANQPTAAEILASAKKLVVQIKDSKGKITKTVDSSTDPGLINCLNTELATLTQYETDAVGIESRVQAYIKAENLDKVILENDKLKALKPNVQAAIVAAAKCQGATELADGTTMQVTVTGGKKGDEGDASFGASPGGTTRTEEASARG